MVTNTIINTGYLSCSFIVLSLRYFGTIASTMITDELTINILGKSGYLGTYF